MWGTLLALILKGVNLIWPDKSPEKVDADDGVISGIAQQKAVDQEAVIQDVQDAKAASDSVDNSLYSGLSVTKSDGFRRD